MTKTTISCGLEKGKLKILPNTIKRLHQDLSEFPDCDVELTVKKKGKRSHQQNAYYWSTVVNEIRIKFKEYGNHVDNEDIHEMLKRNFNKQYIKDDNGEVIDEYGGSTTELNVGEFADYLNRIIEWAATRLGLTISAPGEQTEIPYMIATRDTETNSIIIRKAS